MMFSTPYIICKIKLQLRVSYLPNLSWPTETEKHRIVKTIKQSQVVGVRRSFRTSLPTINPIRARSKITFSIPQINVSKVIRWSKAFGSMFAPSPKNDGRQHSVKCPFQNISYINGGAFYIIWSFAQFSSNNFY